MAEQYALPDGFTVTALGEADSTWNGFPVPILDGAEVLRLFRHISEEVDELDDDVTFTYVDDGKVTAGYYCDGLQWEIVTA